MPDFNSECACEFPALKNKSVGVTQETRAQELLPIYNSDSLVPSSPTLTGLLEYFTRWEDLARKLPALISERRIREEVHALPPLEMGTHQPRAVKRMPPLLLSMALFISE